MKKTKSPISQAGKDYYNAGYQQGRKDAIEEYNAGMKKKFSSNMKERKFTKAERLEALRFIKEFGNPVTTEIKWYQKWFYPVEYFYLREIIYAEIIRGKLKLK